MLLLCALLANPASCLACKAALLAYSASLWHSPHAMCVQARELPLHIGDLIAGRYQVRGRTGGSAWYTTAGGGAWGAQHFSARFMQPTMPSFGGCRIATSDL